MIQETNQRREGRRKEEGMEQEVTNKEGSGKGEENKPGDV